MLKKRRQFLKQSALGAASISFANLPLPAWAGDSDDHFYIHFVASGGWDPTYMFDARPLDMTKNKLQNNYLGEEPKPMNGVNGGTSLRSSLTDKLMSHQDVFSVVNGVVMAHAFDGHGQNMNYLFSGNPFGGNSFVPYLSKESKFQETSVVGIQSGNLFLQVKNHGEIIPLGGASGEKLVRFLKASPMIDTSKPLFKFIRDCYLSNAQGKGKFSLANQKLAGAVDKQEELFHQFKDIKFDPSNTNVVKQNVELLSSVFNRKVARVAIVTIDPPPPMGAMFFNLDTHFVDDAKNQRELYKSLLDMIVNYIDALRATPFDETRSLMDVTTFMVSSEFSRTMRQVYAKFENTGTDHNPLNNSLIIGGKGIRAGQVIGESDFKTSDEVLTGAHMEKDKNKVKVMGRPFDFNSQKSAQSSPGKFAIEDYLNSQSVTNTIMSLFGVPQKHHWKLSNNGGPAPILTRLLS